MTQYVIEILSGAAIASIVIGICILVDTLRLKLEIRKIRANRVHKPGTFGGVDLEVERKRYERYVKKDHVNWDEFIRRWHNHTKKIDK